MQTLKTECEEKLQDLRVRIDYAKKGYIKECVPLLKKNIKTLENILSTK